MAATLLPSAELQFCDSNGKPLAGGKVYFYIPNTTTPKNTWQDPQQTILNPNPVVLDAAGRAIIWGAGTYRQQVYDQFGNLIWDQITEDTSGGLLGNMTDNIFVAGTDFTPGTTTQLTLTVPPGAVNNTWIYFDGVYQDDTQSSLSGNKLTFTSPIPVGVGKVTVKIGNTIAIGTPGDGTVTDASVATNAGIKSSKLSFLLPKTGAVSRTVLSRLSDVVSVKDFGAVMDGVTDDTAAFNTACAVLGAAGGGVLFVPAGTTLVSTLITIPANVYIQGSGAGATIVYAVGSNDVFYLPGSNSGISNLSILGQSTRTGGRFIQASGSFQTIRELEMTYYYIGIQLNSAIQYVENISMNGGVSGALYAIWISSGNDQYIRGVVQNSGFEPVAGLYVSACTGAWISDCDFLRCQHGILMFPNGAVQILYMFFDNVACDSGAGNGITLQVNAGGQIADCCFTQCWSASAANYGVQTVSLDGTGSIDGVSFSNCRFVNNGLDGVLLQSNTKNVIINGCIVSGNSQRTANTYPGIRLAAGISDVTIAACMVKPTGLFADTQHTQIQIDTGTGNHISITGCDLTTANVPLSLGATGTDIYIEANLGIRTEGSVATTTNVAGQVQIAHNTGATPVGVLITLNTSAAYFVASYAFTTTTFNVQFYNTSGSVLANTAVNFTWKLVF